MKDKSVDSINDLQQLWLKHFNQTIGEVQDRTETNPLDWRAGGRATKEWPNKQNGDWWQDQGAEMLGTFTRWWEANTFQIWTTPAGQPAIECGFNHPFGQTMIKAVADLIAVTDDGELAVIDFKTGAFTPDTSMQLGLYAVCCEQVFGIRPTRGYFYDARKGVAQPVDDLDKWTYDLFTELFRQFEVALANNIYLPNAGQSCRTCGVQDYCYVGGGSNHELYDNLTPSKIGETK